MCFLCKWEPGHFSINFGGQSLQVPQKLVIEKKRVFLLSAINYSCVSKDLAIAFLAKPLFHLFIFNMHTI